MDNKTYAMRNMEKRRDTTLHVQKGLEEYIRSSCKSFFKIYRSIGITEATARVVLDYDPNIASIQSLPRIDTLYKIELFLEINSDYKRFEKAKVE